MLNFGIMYSVQRHVRCRDAGNKLLHPKINEAETYMSKAGCTAHFGPKLATLSVALCIAARNTFTLTQHAHTDKVTW